MAINFRNQTPPTHGAAPLRGPHPRTQWRPSSKVARDLELNSTTYQAIMEKPKPIALRKFC